MNDNGFTVIELIIVISIIGILSLLAIIGLNSTTNYSLTTTREQAVEALRSTRSEAISRNTLVGIEMVDAAAGAFAIKRYSGSPGSYTAVNTIRNITLGDNSKAFTYNYSNVNMIRTGVYGVVFDRRGTVHNATGTPVTVQIRNGALVSNISIERDTGYAH